MEKYKICPSCKTKNPPALFECMSCEADLTGVKITDEEEEEKDSDSDSDKEEVEDIEEDNYDDTEEEYDEDATEELKDLVVIDEDELELEQ